MTKLLIIGLDGATFQVIKPLCDEGKLPVISELLDNGVHGVLSSTFPPVTGPAWTALATGKNPGKTGVFDSLNYQKRGDRAPSLMSSADIRKAGAFWDYLSDAGYKVGIINYPFLYPPYRINGIMVSGLGSNPEGKIYYPEEFGERLVQRCGKFMIEVPLTSPIYANNPSLFLKHINKLLDVNESTLELSLKSDLDILFYVMSASDFIQHYMWKYIDSSHPNYESRESEKYRAEFVRVWQRIDDIIGTAMKGLPKDANLLIVSDHGFGPHLSDFYTNSWLENEGYCFRKTGKNSQEQSRKKLMAYLVSAIGRLSPFLYGKLKTVFGGKGLAAGLSIIDQIDCERSLAFSPENTSLIGKICLNHPVLIQKSIDYEMIRDEIIQKLHRTCEALGVSLKVYLPDDLYQGKYVELAPDILFEIEDCACHVRYSFAEDIYHDHPVAEIPSGSHRKDGILIAYGPDIKRNSRQDNASIYDIAPTILHMCGLPVSLDMDGQVLKRILREESNLLQQEILYYEANSEQKRTRNNVKRLKRSKTI